MRCWVAPNSEAESMQELGMRRKHPELKSLVLEASQALSRLDADRLEGLALSCRALNRELKPLSPEQRAVLARQAREAAGDMATFAHVLEATKANLGVMNRLREMRLARLESIQRPAKGTADAESVDGDD
jgi:hypothetical protein